MWLAPKVILAIAILFVVGFFAFALGRAWDYENCVECNTTEVR